MTGYGFGNIVNRLLFGGVVDKAKVIAAIRRFRRAIAAAVTVPVLVGLHKLGVEIDSLTAQILIDAVLVSVIVALIPSAKDVLGDDDGDV